MKKILIPVVALLSLTLAAALAPGDSAKAEKRYGDAFKAILAREFQLTGKNTLTDFQRQQAAQCVDRHASRIAKIMRDHGREETWVKNCNSSLFTADYQAVIAAGDVKTFVEALQQLEKKILISDAGYCSPEMMTAIVASFSQFVEDLSSYRTGVPELEKRNFVQFGEIYIQLVRVRFQYRDEFVARFVHAMKLLYGTTFTPEDVKTVTNAADKLSARLLAVCIKQNLLTALLRSYNNPAIRKCHADLLKTTDKNSYLDASKEFRNKLKAACPELASPKFREAMDNESEGFWEDVSQLPGIKNMLGREDYRFMRSVLLMR